uniref:Uncharacterized protein n=1 Tax=Anguilla anguilla TaxID=7936 RepID=A0A0E9WB08_ANGAN
MISTGGTLLVLTISVIEAGTSSVLLYTLHFQKYVDTSSN